MCDTCKTVLEEVNKSDYKCPILLEKTTFNVFSHYKSTKKSKKSRGYLSSTSYGGFICALTHLYCMSGKTMNREFE